MANFIRSDLDFILQQIKIAEAHAAGADLRTILPNVQVPYGLRTVDGSSNNLVQNQSEYGAADNVFPRLLDPAYRPAEAGTTYDSSGGVLDTQPRVISNLLVDQTINNPAAISAALKLAGSSNVQGDTANIVNANQALKAATANAVAAASAIPALQAAVALATSAVAAANAALASALAAAQSPAQNLLNAQANAAAAAAVLASAQSALGIAQTTAANAVAAQVAAQSAAASSSTAAANADADEAAALAALNAAQATLTSLQTTTVGSPAEIAAAQAEVAADIIARDAAQSVFNASNTEAQAAAATAADAGAAAVLADVAEADALVALETAEADLVTLILGGGATPEQIAAQFDVIEVASVSHSAAQTASNAADALASSTAAAAVVEQSEADADALVLVAAQSDLDASQAVLDDLQALVATPAEIAAQEALIIDLDTAYDAAVAASEAADLQAAADAAAAAAAADAAAAAALAEQAAQDAAAAAQALADAADAAVADAQAIVDGASQVVADAQAVVDSATGDLSNSQAALDAGIVTADTAAQVQSDANTALHDLLTSGGIEFETSPGLDGLFGTADDKDVIHLPNVTPDAGLSAPFNAWMTFFGQFFDHGLDLVTKGGNSSIFMPLLPDDPLYVEGSPTNFMVLTRATQVEGAGADGVLADNPETAINEAADNTRETMNTTSPFVDQNQTYSSHPSHQVFLRAYAMTADGPVSTGELLTNRDLGPDGQFGTGDDVQIGGMATWGVMKAQARDILGINLTDADVGSVPLLATDQYGNFIRGEHGFPMVVFPSNVLVEGDPTANGGLGISLTGAVRTGHAFLDDIAHDAAPKFTAGLGADGVANSADDLNPDADAIATGSPEAGTYNNELLDSHYVAGDGRVNENIGLTAVHAIFHSEHNRLVEQTKDVILSSGDLAFLNEWLRVDVAALPTTPAEIDALQWDGARVFQAAKFGTEMQYQHLVFEEFARTIQPQVDGFLAPNGYDTLIDPSIVAEFAHTVYRFGHSMLTETVDRLDADLNPVTFDPLHPTNDQQLGLIAAFLNPLAYEASGATPEEATAAIVRGVTRQVGNEIDEFVTEALRNNLVGLPLDLPALNIARGRDTGIPSLNEARRDFFAMTGDVQLKPYISWADMVYSLRHPESVINFIAAYGTHGELLASDVNTLEEKRAVALALVMGGEAVINAGTAEERTFIADDDDRMAFLNSTGIYHNAPNGATTTGVDLIDFWIGGLAEKQMPFGGLLGSTFNFVFETQLENLQNGDRFYYLSRTAGMHFGTELENNSFSHIIEVNTGATHLPANVFTTPTYILEVDQSKQLTGLGVDGHGDPTNGGLLTPEVIRDNPNTAGPDANYLQYTGVEHVVLGGTEGNDTLIASEGDDSLWGDGGNDRIEGGYGNDVVRGGAGDDIITDMGGDDVLHGDEGNDVIQVGNMAALGAGNIVFGGTGNDFIITTEDVTTSFGGEGNDFILGAKTNLPATGGEGDDWIEMGTQDGAPGDNAAPLLQDDVPGNDIFIGGGGFDEMLGEGGDDIFTGSDAQDKMEGLSGFDWVTYKNDQYGVTADLAEAALAQPHGNTINANTGVFLPVAASAASLFDRFAEVEGISGSRFADVLYGDNIDAVTIVTHAGAETGALTNVSLINGLEGLLSEAGLSTLGFATGNIMLGGAGSDLIMGRGGDDLIDGDRWLNVRISVRQNADGTGPEIDTFDSMTGRSLFAVDATGKTLMQNMLDRTYNPGQLVAVREILDNDNAFDTALFQGNNADYTIFDNGNGTFTVVDSVAGRDGVDTLVNIERLQFNDISVTLQGDNNDPTGNLSIVDGVSLAADNTPTQGQLLRVNLGSVVDLDGINPATISYVWQAETAPGTGLFQDIVVGPVGDLAVQTANGATFRPAATEAGLALRVKAMFLDNDGTTETVYSAATDPVAASAPTPVVPAVAAPVVTNSGAGIFMAQSDLSFILDQIKIAERHASGEQSLYDLLPNARSALGLRTVTGEFNNLVHPEYGAADNPFPRISDPVFDNAQAGTSYDSAGGVVDSTPRTISNLIVDQTANNPAAVAAAEQNGGAGITVSPGLDGLFGTADDKEVFYIPNVTPDAGLSAPFNAWMTFFGQFFDHGLDLVTKGGNSSIFMPLLPDDPLYVEGSPTNFMVLTRATQVEGAGADGVLADNPETAINEAADNTRETMNTTSPFVDQNQTYSSHPSHQVFLRAYAMTADGPVSTGELLTNRDLGPDGQFGTGDDVQIGGMATWGVMKAQARDILGINLTDADVGNVPLLATDQYGNFIRGEHGFPMVVFPSNVLVEGDPTANGGLGISLTGAVRTGHAFLDDIAHDAAPKFTAGLGADGVANSADDLNPDADAIATGSPEAGTYNNELLDSHYVAGDGRVNENIGLTAVHAIFHSEHNRLVEQNKDTILKSGDLAFLNEWLRVDVTALPTTPAEIDALQWDGERLFQSAKFGTEMQYQHLAFEEFARTIQPNVDLFFAPTQVYDVELDASIVAEFAHTVYRFGHSMLTETVDRLDADFNAITVDPLHPTNDQQLGLIAAFLNPLAFAASGDTPEEAVGAIVRGVTRQVGNEIDEFVTEALRNNLVGLPLDLPALNIARGRDTGIPSLNEFRRDIHNQTGDSQLKPYVSWADLVSSLRHPESVINFIAAYGTHDSITSETTLAGKRAAALLLVLGGDDAPTDRLDFLNSTGAWANHANGVTITGVDDIDFWIGGLAEEQMPFGGMLGSTFNFVFENQLEKLQDGDRFYYLERTAGLAFAAELEGNSFARLIMANTDATHLPALVFTTPAYTLEVDQSKQYTGLGVDGRDDPTNGILLTPEVIRDNPDTAGPDSNYLRYTGVEHVVLGGTSGNDILISSEGDDSVWGDEGDDYIDGGYGVDNLRGGAGDDIIVDLGGDDNIQGGDGNDVIHGGNGINLIIGGSGSDFIITGEDASEAIAGQGNDFIYGNKANEQDMGNEGDDWIELGTSDGAPGDNFDPLGNDPVIGNDVFIGGGENDKFNGEGGDDIMQGGVGLGNRYIGGSGFDWAIFKGDPHGVDIDLVGRFFDQPVVPGSGASALTRFDVVEGISGSSQADVLQGDDVTDLSGQGATGSTLSNIALINGLQELLGAGVTSFNTGNIILAGGGSDRIEGRGGDDRIDGDAWLNVRISVRSTVDLNNDHIADRDANGELILGAEIDTFDSMAGRSLFAVDPTGKTLMQNMLDRTYNPGQLQIVREILTSPTHDFDTAVFSGAFANYTIAINGVAVTNNVFNFAAGDIVTVTDNVGTDGTDTLTHIERLQFEDQAVVGAGVNAAPVGAPTFNQQPVEDQPITVSMLGVTDANNVSTGGTIPNPVSYFWQQETAPGVFSDILVFLAGEDSRVSGPTYTPTETDVNTRLRVRAVYKDENGVLEQVFSAPTDPVVNVNDAPIGTVGIDSLAPIEDLFLTASTLGISDEDGMTTSIFSFQWQQSLDGLTWTDIADATDRFFAPSDPQVNQHLRVQVQFTDDHGTLETLFSAATAPVVNVNDAPSAGPVLEPTDAYVGLPIVADAATIVDDDGLLNAAFSYQWEESANGTDWTVIDGATNPGFSPTASQVGHVLRVVVSYVDDHGTTESVPSEPTATVLANAPATGAPVINDTTPTQDIAITANTASILDANGLTGAVFAFQWQMSTNGGASWTNVAGAQSATFTPGAGQVSNLLRVRVTFNDDLGNAETLFSAATGGTGIHSVGNGNANTIPGTAFDDWLQGLGGNDILNGLAGSDILDGGAGNDTLNGGAGADQMTGGANDDTYVVDDAGDVLTEGGGAGSGTDTVQTTLNAFTLAANFENLSYTGAGSFTGTGNAVANVINSNGGADTLNGGAGNDTINAGGGADIINYVMGEGADTVNGGGGNDRLNILGTAANDILNVVYNGAVLTNVAGGAVSNVESFTADLAPGADTLNYTTTTAAVTVNLATGAASGFTSIAGISSITSGSGNDNLSGDGLANVINAAGGNDTLFGGAGIDTLNGGTGTDTASYAGETAAMFISLATNTARRGSAAAAIEDTLVSIENVTGGNGNDTITGDNNANVINGGAGLDTINAGGGNDTIAYVTGQGADVVNGGGGTDTLNITGTAANDTLSVILTGGALTSIAGGAITSIEVINANLAPGADTLSYQGSNSAVTANLAAATASGFASIGSIANVTGGNVNDNLTGDGNDNILIGNSGNDALSGGGGQDRLDGGIGVDNLNGGGGRDVLIGGAGNDAMNGGNGNDTFSFSALFGADTITGFDADAGGGGQDLLDVSAMGITAANFAAHVVITDLGANMQVTIDGVNSIVLLGVNGVGANTITQGDFIFA